MHRRNLKLQIFKHCSKKIHVDCSRSCQKNQISMYALLENVYMQWEQCKKVNLNVIQIRGETLLKRFCHVLQRKQRSGSLHRTITDDEKWHYYDNPKPPESMSDTRWTKFTNTRIKHSWFKGIGRINGYCKLWVASTVRNHHWRYWQQLKRLKQTLNKINRNETPNTRCCFSYMAMTSHTW